ncbi:amidohydrolase family protein [Oceanihabitans sediminis]|uniref:Amidohydrolase n=2 Tax=Pseudomonadati TaxID=3379134 RepID=A0A368P4H2_9FLAO|nr:amidohydrolase family protein [Oceanihabitans sediminis]MDX1277971.1 amidohydrolase family protein [Oceanihabitans sediminis]MDX1774120.1 amidohydrolase family protein [Oceanihabitans sediminis]RBP30839.1 imidazolonepropionase-like amidohydrolase [Oceanihabitans sediminis]RCU56805.1 amidohydrolase [Oceanihabitans sediminis]
MKKINNYIITAFLLCTTFLFAQQTPAPKQTKAICIMGATAHIGNGEVIENSIIIFNNGKIETVADARLVKIDISNMDLIKAEGKHVYPGFIVPNSTLGLGEIDAVRATIDSDELGSLNPHIRSLIAYNTESKVIETMRPNGVLLAQITPQGGRISGTSSIVHLDAWNWEDAAVKVDDGIHINWPRPYTRGRWWRGEPSHLKPNKEYGKQVEELANFFKQSKVYQQSTKEVKNLPFEALAKVTNGSAKLFIHVDDAKGITDATEFAKANDIANMVIVGGYEAYKVTDLLKQNNIPIILNRVHSRPNSDDEDYDLPFKMAKKLVDSGIVVALQANGDMERMNSRNLPFYAGTCVAYGLDKEEALKLITSNTAKILGIDDTFGTLESGKDATLFISEGDALDIRTNKLIKAFVQGRNLSLESHQTQLSKRYSEKYQE